MTVVEVPNQVEMTSVIAVGDTNSNILEFRDSGGGTQLSSREFCYSGRGY